MDKLIMNCVRSMLLFSLLYACKYEVTYDTSDPKPEDKATTGQSELFDQIMTMDSLLFEVGFNQIDTAQMASLTSADFEFYHDDNGIVDSKTAFLNSINSLKDLPFKTWRTMVDGSMEVFPMYKDNGQVLYGAIQKGVHEFYQQKEGEEARKTSTARFTHLWMIENGDWKLKRVLSYDHRTPE